MKVTQLALFAAIGAFFLPETTIGHLIFIVLTMFSLVFGIRMFVQDKRELKAAKYYVRMRRTKSWKSFVYLLIAIAFVIAFVRLMEHYKIELESSVYILYCFPILLADIYGNYYQHFTDSIRSFENGLKLPGRSNPLIDWENIEKMTLDESEVTFEIAGIERPFKIDDRDREDANGMIGQWQENNDKTWDLDSI